jgi:hypothetical protein
MMEQDISISGVFLFMIYAVIILVGYRLVRFVLNLINLRNETRRLIRRNLPIAELFTWIFLLLWAMPMFWNKFPLYSYLMFALLLTLILISAWYMFRDLIAGIILKSNKNFTVNETISIGDHTGRIIRFESRYIILETLSGKNIHLPYSEMIGKMISKSNPVEKIISSKFYLEVSKDKNISELIVKLQEDILTLPWSSVKKSPQIKIKKEDVNCYQLELIIFSIEQSYLYRIEQFIKEKYAMAKK